MVKRYYQFDAQSKEIQQYLKGETLEGTGQKGYGVLFADSYPLAFYEENNRIVKNRIPEGLRKQYEFLTIFLEFYPAILKTYPIKCFTDTVSCPYKYKAHKTNTHQTTLTK